MRKFLILLSTIVATVAAADYGIRVANNDNSQSLTFTNPAGTRVCICLVNTQSATIQGVNGDTIKTFTTSDCTGNFTTIGSNSLISNAQWVNSISFGSPNLASSGPGACPNWY